ncbi:MAG: hypothetical protein WA869_13390 [Alloacidobacterium sp.]
MIEQGGEHRLVAADFKRLVRRRIEQSPRQFVTERWRAALVVVRQWPLDTIDRVAGNAGDEAIKCIRAARSRKTGKARDLVGRKV